jgi:transposase
MLKRIVWILQAGAQWRELPGRYGRWEPVYHRWNRWRRDGTIDRMIERLHLKLDEQGRVDVDLWCIDATRIRASRAAAGAAGGGKGGGWAGAPRSGPLPGGHGTKLHLVVDGHGSPLGGAISTGQRHKSKFVEPVLRAVRLVRPGVRGGRPRSEPRPLADKGYSYRTVRRYLRRRGIRAVIPTRKDQRVGPYFDRITYRRRNIVERLVDRLKENRRLATRYEKLAVNFLAMVKIAMIRHCLRVLHS